MTIAANQPYFLPYLGYWQLINAADLFFIGDDYAYMRKSWINRNYIIVNGRPQWLRIEIDDASSFRLIKDTRLKLKSVGEKLRTIEMAYHKAPFFADGYALVSRIFGYDSGGMLSPFLENSIREVCGYLGITTRIGHSSDYEGNNLLKKEERIYDLCRRTGADTYINAIGGQGLYDYAEFRERGFRLRFINPDVPHISVLDSIMSNSREALHDMLSSFTFIDG